MLCAREKECSPLQKVSNVRFAEVKALFLFKHRQWFAHIVMGVVELILDRILLVRCVEEKVSSLFKNH